MSDIYIPPSDWMPSGLKLGDLVRVTWGPSTTRVGEIVGEYDGRLVVRIQPATKRTDMDDWLFNPNECTLISEEDVIP